jgi:hypothetical protein
MAKQILSPPWILPSILEITHSSDHPPSPSSQFPLTRRPKIVQVVRVCSSEGILIINDKHHTMAVLLSTSCIKSFQDEISSSHDLSLDLLQNSVIKMDVWHYSTVIQCLGKRNFNSLTKSLGISLPLAIHCSKISSLGAFDCSVIGSPVDINMVLLPSPFSSCLSHLLVIGPSSAREDVSDLVCDPHSAADLVPIYRSETAP